MSKVNMRESLIDELWIMASECYYLSDLKIPVMRGSVRRALLRIDADDFSLRDWNEAVRYITGGEAETFDSSHEAWRYLYAFCGEKDCFVSA